MKQLKIGLIGAGERGAHCYAPYALKYPHEMKITCVAEPIAERRKNFCSQHNIPPEMEFVTWEDLLNSKPDLDGLIIATQDTQHYHPTMAALEAGYSILLEKPIAESIEQVREMVEKAQNQNLLLMVCHVLRYTPFFQALKKEIQAGTIGDIQAVHMIENIGNWHFAHSFVRGHWRNSETSTPMIVAKCCHDMDILNFLIEKDCQRISSIGSLSYFKKENAPKGATSHCHTCPHNKTCRYTAYNYISDRETYTPFRNIVSRESDAIQYLSELESTPYSRCVYFCDNNVADHQTVQMEYKGGITVSFTASAFTSDVSRQIKIMGTKGELEGKLESDTFYHRDFGSGTEICHKVYAPPTLHSGGDEKIMAHFSSALRNPQAAIDNLGALISLAGHEMAFAAEQSRIQNGKVIELT